jgi:excisionase family DNA binding protein
MGANKQFLTTGEYADQSGLSVAKVTKLLRDGGIKGQKVGGKWTIPASELNKTTPPATTQKQPPKAAAATRTGQQYSVDAFSALTYLTANGVRNWLKKGILKGTRDEDGQWRIDAANLEAPHIKRLVR